MKIIKTALFIITLLNMNSLMAQEFFRLKESIGMPLRSRNYSNLKGTPYFKDAWCKGIIKQENGQNIKDIELMYDQLEDQLTFKDLAGNAMAFAVPVVEFKLLCDNDKATLFRNGFEPFKSSEKNTYYQVLYDGPISLLKKDVKTIQQYREYNSATVTNTVIERIKYYVCSSPGKIVEFKRDGKALDLVFGERSPSVKKYIQDEKLDLKKDDDLIKAFAFNGS